MRLTYRLALLLPFLAACQRSVSSTETGMSVSASASTTGAPGQWRSLFDGKSLDQWRGYKMTTVPPEWTIVDGTIVKEKGTEDIVTKEQFQNFELELDWKLGPGGNAGVFYRGNEEFEHIYWTAPEYQLLDDARHPDGKSRLTSAGSDYALYAARAGVVKPANQWNSSRIVAKGSHVEHWLNGEKLLEYDVGSPDWEARLKKSKFANWAQYGRSATGHIGIQGDHEGELAIRNMRIRPL